MKKKRLNRKLKALFVSLASCVPDFVLMDAWHRARGDSYSMPAGFGRYGDILLHITNTLIPLLDGLERSQRFLCRAPTRSLLGRIADFFRRGDS